MIGKVGDRMQGRSIKDITNLDILLLDEIKEAIRDKIEQRKKELKFHIVRIIAIFILLLVIIWGIMNLFR